MIFKYTILLIALMMCIFFTEAARKKEKVTVDPSKSCKDQFPEEGCIKYCVNGGEEFRKRFPVDNTCPK